MYYAKREITILFLFYVYVIKFINCSTVDLYKNARLGHRIVQTRYGRLHGLILPLDNFRFLRSVEAFLGVPYATPPIKSNRFSPTRAPAPWDGIRISDKYSAVCPQKLPNIQNETATLDKMPKGRFEYLKRLLPFLQNQSEDCLYLNIFSPIHASTTEKKLPVIVFIHGESFEWSSGNPYDGTVLASYGEVVVVTLNYRLGILGFLNANPSPQIRARVANYGLMDIMAALHWVQQNIIKFGGDPNMVTLAGHGTGAACINFLMTSPTMVPGLFHRAILSSGSAYSSWAIVEDPVIYAIKLAKEVNCSIPEDLIKSHEQIVDCLREVPLEELYNANIQAPSFLTVFGPSVDGVVIRSDHLNYNIEDSLSRNMKRSQDNPGRYDTLFGVVTGESIYKFSATDIQNGFESERRNKIIRTFVRNTYNYHLNEIFYTIINEYTDWERTSQHPINTRDTVVAALSDAQFVAPIVRTGDSLAIPFPPMGVERNGPRCYFYVFDYQTKDGDYPQRMGTVHGEDLPYIFGAPLVEGFSHFPSNYTKSEIALSEAVMIYWTNFARTGNPNEHHRQDSIFPASKERNRFRSVTWDEYDQLHQKYLEIGMKPRIKNHFRAHQLSIWLRLIPELHRAGMEDVIARHNLFKNHDDMEMYEGVVKINSLSRFSMLEDSFKRKLGNLSDISMLNGITTVEPSSLTTCLPFGNYSIFAPTTIVNATTDTLSGYEAAGYAAYSTALSVTIAIGCSLLILNVLIFAGVYYQRDKTRLEVKSLQKQYQQRGLHQQVAFDPIKHAHYHLGHPQSSSVIVDVENHDSCDGKTPHICSNTMQITSGCGLTTKVPLSDSACYNTKPPREHIPMKQQQSQQTSFTRNSSSSVTGTTGGTNMQNVENVGNANTNYSNNPGMMTLSKSATLHHSTMKNHGKSHAVGGSGGVSGGVNECMTLSKNTSSTHNPTQMQVLEAQQPKIQPNGSVIGIHHIRTPRTMIRTASISPPEQQQQQASILVSSNSQNIHSHSQQTTKHQYTHQSSDNPNQAINLTSSSHLQQVPQAAMDEMRV